MSTNLTRFEGLNGKIKFFFAQRNSKSLHRLFIYRLNYLPYWLDDGDREAN